jgi:type III secretion protein T
MSDIQSASGILNLIMLFLISIALGSIRFIALIQMFPLFSWTQLQGIKATMIGIGLSVPNIGSLFFELSEKPQIHSGLLLFLFAKETVLGMVLGIVLGMPFYAAQGAGDVIDVYRGASQANLADPVNAQETTVMGTIMILMTLGVFVVSNGLILLLDVLIQSYVVWPVTSLTPLVNFEVSQAVGLGIVGIFRIALLIGGPILIFLALVDLGLVFAGRSTRQFNLYDLSNSLRNLVLFLILPTYFVFFTFIYTEEARKYFEILKNFIYGR